MCISVCVLVSEGRWWCGDYCVPLLVTPLVIITCIITSLVTVAYITIRYRTSHTPADLPQIFSYCCCRWLLSFSKHTHPRRSGVSTEYAFATTTTAMSSSAPAVNGLAVQYTAAVAGLDSETQAPPSGNDWYQLQLTALLQVCSNTLL